MGVYNLQEDSITCLKWGKTNQVVYGYYIPEDNILGDRWMYPGKGGRLMCFKCTTSTIGMQQQEVNVVGDFACAYR
jgi:hypothetical protein